MRQHAIEHSTGIDVSLENAIEFLILVLKSYEELYNALTNAKMYREV